MQNVKSKRQNVKCYAKHQPPFHLNLYRTLSLKLEVVVAEKPLISEGTELLQPTPLWFRSAKNRDVSTGPLARPFAHSLAPLTRSLAPDCSLHSRPPLRSLVRSLAHFAHSLARGTVNDWMAILCVFFSIFDHSAFLL